MKNAETNHSDRAITYSRIEGNVFYATLPPRKERVVVPLMDFTIFNICQTLKSFLDSLADGKYDPRKKT